MISLANHSLSSRPTHREVGATRVPPTTRGNVFQPVQAPPTLSDLDRAMADIFRGLVNEETELLISLCRHVSCHPGQIVVQVGDASGEMFVILEGSLREMARPNGTQSEAPAVYLLGDVVGETPFIAAGIHKRSMIAMEESRLLGLSIETLNDLVLRMPRLAAKVFRNVAGIVATRFQHEIEFSGTGLIPPSLRLLGAIGRAQP